MLARHARRPPGPRARRASPPAPACCAAQHQLVDLARLVRPGRRWRRCACSPSSSRRARRPVDDRRACRAAIAHVARLGVRQRAVRARGDDRRERRLLGAAARASRARASSATSRSVRPARPRSSMCSYRPRRRARAAARIASISPGVLHRAQLLHEAARRRPARPRRRPAPRRRSCWRDGQVLRRRSRPRPPMPLGQRRRAGRCSPAQRARSRGTCSARLLDVAEVGEEEPLVRRRRRTAPLVPVKPVR